jgi:hypothetical protein
LTLILTLLSFLIDVLLFVPHMAWGSYIVLAATILVAASGIVSCAMRRTLVSRKARKRRIAENAEMNGENFYNRQGGNNSAVPPTAESNTLVNGGPGVDKLPAFATFEMTKPGQERTSDERIPLTTRSPIESSPNMAAAAGNGYGPPTSSGNGSPPRPAREFDEYGNPLPAPAPAQGAYGQGAQSRDQSLNRQYSGQSARGRGMPPGGYRGRGGYPPNGRGGYGQPRGGYAGPPRGGYGQPRGGFAPRGRGGQPPGYGPPQNGPNYNRNQSPAGGYRGPSPARVPGYGDNTYAAAVPMPSGGYTPFRPEDDRSSVARAESPPPLPGFDAGPVGQAVEMDATTGSPSHAPRGYGNFGPIRESDGDVAGMVGLQQQLQQQRDGEGRQTVVSETSRYSTDE